MSIPFYHSPTRRLELRVVTFAVHSRVAGHWAAAWKGVLLLAAGLLLFMPDAHAQHWTTNLALRRPASASSVAPGHPQHYAVDGDDQTFWQSDTLASRQQLTIHLSQPRRIDRVLLPLSSGFESLRILAREEGGWTPVYTRPQEESQGEGLYAVDHVLFGFPEPVTTSKVRLRFLGAKSVRVNEVKVYAHRPQPVFVNQSGYNLRWPKRFTAPLAEEGTSFFITKKGNNEVLYRGKLTGHIGDFTTFQPGDTGPFVITVKGDDTGRSVPFRIGPYWIERVSYQPAVNFMVDSRCWWGDARGYAPTDSDPDCPDRGVAWRDGTQYSFEVPTLIWMWFANPSAFTPERMPVQGPYLGLREELPEDTPEIVRLIYWGVDIYLRGNVRHPLLKEQLAYFVYAYPTMAEYIPRSVYEEAKTYLFAHWSDPEKDRWTAEDFNFGDIYAIEESANLFQTYTTIGTGKGYFPPGHSVIPNLMMYEVALREGRPDARKYFEAAYDQTQWMVDSLDWEDPRTTKGQRMSEHVTMEGLAYFLEAYPEKAPPRLREKIRAWAEEMIARSDNMWDFRKYSAERWVIPGVHPDQRSRFGFNEPGNVAGFPASALAAAGVLKDEGIKQRLRELAISHIDNVFGRNPTGRHFSYDAGTDFEGVELGWFKEYQGGAGKLQHARGVLDGSPKETTYPYNPYAGDPVHTEGWVAFNTAWNAALAYLSAAAAEIGAFGPDFEEQRAEVRPGGTLSVQLTAPLNFDYDTVETGTVQVMASNGDALELIVHETSEKGFAFRGTVPVQEGPVDPEDDAIQAAPGDTITVSYGYGPFKERARVAVQ